MPIPNAETSTNIVSPPISATSVLGQLTHLVGSAPSLSTLFTATTIGTCAWA